VKLTEASIERPVLAWMIMAALVVFGAVALDRIGISQFPDVDFPTISVSAEFEGAAPEIMENDVVEPLEEELIQIEGIRSLTSVARQGSATVTVELDLARDVDLALQDVQAKVYQARNDLPRDMEPPTISKSNPEDNPIMWLGLSGPFPQQVLADYVRYRIKERLQTIPGVGEIVMGGYLERNVRIWIDASALDQRGLVVGDVLRALQRGHLELPAGRLDTEGREINVRVLGEALDLASFRRIVVGGSSGRPVYLEDVALVEDGFEDVRRLARVDGAPAQGIGIKKQRGSNAVAVAKAVHAELDQIRKGLPEGMVLGINFDSTRFVEEAVSEIQFELVLSVVLTALVCWLFLGSIGSTLNVILAIPMSLLGTVAVIYFLGFTLNTFTLLGLALAVGIVVDDAIMVMENIYRHVEMGKDRVRAAREGTAEIAFAALAATIAVVAIFSPVIFMQGIIGKFFLQFGVTLSVAVMFSYLEAITLTPARSAQMLQAGRERRGLGGWVDRAFDRLAIGYRWLLARILFYPVTALVVAAALTVLAAWVFTVLPAEFVPSQDQSRLMVRLQTAVGSDLEETDALFRKAEAVVNGSPVVRRSFVVVGGFGGAGVNGGVIFVTMVPPEARPVTQQQFQAQLRKDLNAIPGLKAIVQDLSQQGFTAQRGFPIEFSVRGPDWERLVEIADQMTRDLQATGMVVDVDTDYRIGVPELRITPNRARAADLGVPVEDVATGISALVGGVRAGKYETGGRRIDIRARLLASQRSKPEDLARIKVRARSGELVPLSSLVTYEEVPALQAVTRRDRERAISVFANVAPAFDQKTVLEQVEQLGAGLPTGYRAVLGGASQAFRESMGSLIFALVLGIAVAYMVLGAQFNSFLHPVTVLTILPLSVAGAAYALWLSGRSLNIFSMIGLLLLMGIVKKNSIILVDYANQARARGAGALEAMLMAGPVRLRPILMTTTTTFMAALPPALGLGAGAEIRTPMAIAVIGGLLLSTTLSLLVVPAFYVVADRVRGWVAARFRRGKRAVVADAAGASGVVLALLLGGAGAAGEAKAAGPAPAPAGREAAWRAVVATELAFAREAEARGTKEAFLAFLAEDGVVFQPGPVNGRSWWKDRPKQPGVLRWRPAFAAVARDGELGFTTGPWVFEAPPREGAPAAPPPHGWFATIWQRQADGTYRFAADGGIGAGGPAPDLAAVAARESFRPSQADPAQDESVRVMSLEAMEARFLALAREQGLAAAYGELLDPEARALRGERGLLSGREQIVAAAGTQPVPAGWTVQNSGVAASNDLGYTWGAWVAAGEKPASGWFLRAWRREPGGGWQLALDLLMTAPAGS
jgi:hydrophobe/amphiphile efflux-1 (HAE1) family protein